MFSACDTFRAAAIEQLESWANKIGVKTSLHKDQILHQLLTRL